MNEEENVVYVERGWFVIPVSSAQYQPPSDSPVPPLVALPVNFLASIPLPTYVPIDPQYDFQQTYAGTDQFSQTPISVQAMESWTEYPPANANGACYSEFAQTTNTNIWDIDQYNRDSCQLNGLSLFPTIGNHLVNIESSHCNQEELNWGNENKENTRIEENWDAERQIPSQTTVDTAEQETKAENEGDTDNGKYLCQECRKEFGRDADLKRHKRTAKPHRLSREFQCICSISFSRVDALKVVIILIIASVLISL
jgi:hypothetical protein